LTTELFQNYPNPFNPTTTIQFAILNESYVSIEIFDIKGRKIRTLVKENYTVGTHKTVWDGLDDNNKIVSSGVYLYRMISDGHIETKKMLLIK